MTDFRGHKCGECYFHSNKLGEGGTFEPREDALCLRYPPAPVATPKETTRVTPSGPVQHVVWIVNAHARLTGNGFFACGEFKFKPEIQPTEH